MTTVDNSDPGEKFVYHWDEITTRNEQLFGQKCSRLAIARQAGLPVPPFFAITQDGVRRILENGSVPEELGEEVDHFISRLEADTGRSFGETGVPLILAIRSGDPFSMAGAMFSYLNVGLNRATLPALVEEYGEEAPFLHMYLDSLVDFASMVEGKSPDEMEEVLTGLRNDRIDANRMRKLVDTAGEFAPGFPQRCRDHLDVALKAVAFSWQNFSTSAFREEMHVASDVYPSIFIQQMSFGNLSNSAFLALCTRNPIDGKRSLHGDFAYGTEGRRMMRGIGPVRYHIDKLGELFEDLPPLLERYTDQIENLFFRPQDIEATVERGQLNFVQIVDAHLTSSARRKIVTEMRGEGILARDQQIPPIPGIRRTRVIKTHRLRPDVSLKRIARGHPSHPGAVEGRLALCADDAIRLGKRGTTSIILLLSDPDERILPMLLKRQIDGFAARYHSAHDSAAAMLCHVPAIMSVNAQVEGNNFLIGERSKIAAGQRIILDGNSGELFEAPPSKEIVLIEDKPILVTPHDLVGYELEEETRRKYLDRSYDELLQEHARFVAQLGDARGDEIGPTLPREEAVDFARRELITHYIHLMIFEKAQEKDLSYFGAQLDVALADGSLDRVPGLEHKRIALERDGRRVTLILGTSVSYEMDTIEEMAFSNAEIEDTVRMLKEDGVEVDRYVKQSKLSRHTQYISTTCIEFDDENIGEVVKRLRQIEAISSSRA